MTEEIEPLVLEIRNGEFVALATIRRKPRQRAKAMNPRLCLPAHQPNPSFEGTRLDVLHSVANLHRRAPQL